MRQTSRIKVKSVQSPPAGLLQENTFALPLLPESEPGTGCAGDPRLIRASERKKNCQNCSAM